MDKDNGLPGRVEKVPKRKKEPYTRTLCWSCGRALPHRGCEWADSFTPVDGWTAKPTVKRNVGHLSIKSFHVYKCPKFAKCRDVGRVDENSDIAIDGYVEAGVFK